MTQQQLARIIGVAFQQVHKYEHGLSRVSADRLYQIATALDSQVGYFFSAEDGLVPPAFGEAYRALIPGSRLVVLPQAGHAPFDEQKDAFLSAFREFSDEI